MTKERHATSVPAGAAEVSGRLSSARLPRKRWSRYNCCIWSSARGGFKGIAPLRPLLRSGL